MPPKRSEPVSGLANPFVKSFTHLRDKPDPARALAMLERIASLVKPIMRKHAWTLPVLAEFFPNNPNLLDVNGGQKIMLRLRPHFDEAAFMDEEDVLGTMLHELTHNIHGPHDEKFYKFLGELEDELDGLRRSGYAGEGFHSPGVRLGAGLSHDLPPHQARLKALEAAEKRRNIGGMSTVGGSRLGGGTRKDRSGKSLRELAAEAAERRARDSKACASGEEAEAEAKHAADHSIVVDVIDLTEDDEPILAAPRPASSGPVRSDRKRPPEPGPSSRPASAPRADDRVRPSAASSSRSAPQRQQKRETSTDAQWPCPSCTLLNAPLALQCDLCLTTRPMSSSSVQDAGWVCVSCGEGGNHHEFWTCRFCGTMRPFS
ncbi:WLM-domain-containing protein [Exidia glandulosa HHB12029]|uniref:WLM-domain-containing protein n=1 Tax=Exidia glandulosa HHB12029 TaxID=1314781 RepID=A0A165IQY7_EXIGL|nr:WLM-domain-containing protein [Exidia glandulosa HHB12029]